MSRKIESPYYIEMPNGYQDGWNDWNPHETKCLECGSSNIEFFWNNGIVNAIHCKDCDVEEYGK